MLFRSKFATLIAVVLPLPGWADPPESYARAELAFTRANPDFRSLNDETGESLLLSLAGKSGWILNAYYNNTEFVPGGPRTGYRLQSHSLAVGGGYRWGLTQQLFLHAGLAYEERGLGGRDEAGAGIFSGIRYRPRRQFELALEAKYLDIGFSDWELLAEVFYYPRLNWFASLRLRDYAEADFTMYELGLGRRF